MFFLLLATSYHFHIILHFQRVGTWSLGILEWEQGRRPIMNLICGRLCVAAKGMINNHGRGDRRKADKELFWSIVGGTRLGYGRL
jgi:hypothetical protein